MPKGIPNKKYTGELKQKLVELVRNGGLSQREVSPRGADWLLCLFKAEDESKARLHCPPKHKRASVLTINAGSLNLSYPFSFSFFTRSCLSL